MDCKDCSELQRRVCEILKEEGLKVPCDMAPHERLQRRDFVRSRGSVMKALLLALPEIDIDFGF